MEGWYAYPKSMTFGITSLAINILCGVKSICAIDLDYNKVRDLAKCKNIFNLDCKVIDYWFC